MAASTVSAPNKMLRSFSRTKVAIASAGKSWNPYQHQSVQSALPLKSDAFTMIKIGVIFVAFNILLGATLAAPADKVPDKKEDSSPLKVDQTGKLEISSGMVKVDPAVFNGKNVDGPKLQSITVTDPKELPQQADGGSSRLLQIDTSNAGPQQISSGQKQAPDEKLIKNLKADLPPQQADGGRLLQIDTSNAGPQQISSEKKQAPDEKLFKNLKADLPPQQAKGGSELLQVDTSNAGPQQISSLSGREDGKNVKLGANNRFNNLKAELPEELKANGGAAPDGKKIAPPLNVQAQAVKDAISSGPKQPSNDKKKQNNQPNGADNKLKAQESKTDSGTQVNGNGASQNLPVQKNQAKTEKKLLKKKSKPRTINNNQSG